MSREELMAAATRVCIEAVRTGGDATSALQDAQAVVTALALFAIDEGALDADAMERRKTANRDRQTRFRKRKRNASERDQSVTGNAERNAESVTKSVTSNAELRDQLRYGGGVGGVVSSDPSDLSAETSTRSKDGRTDQEKILRGSLDPMPSPRNASERDKERYASVTKRDAVTPAPEGVSRETVTLGNAGDASQKFTKSRCQNSDVERVFSGKRKAAGGGSYRLQHSDYDRTVKACEWAREEFPGDPIGAIGRSIDKFLAHATGKEGAENGYPYWAWGNDPAKWLAFEPTAAKRQPGKPEPTGAAYQILEPIE